MGRSWGEGQWWEGDIYTGYLQVEHVGISGDLFWMGSVAVL